MADASAAIQSLGIAARIIYSGGEFLDVVAVDKGDAVSYAARELSRRAAPLAGQPTGDQAPLVVVAEDSMNGAAMLEVADLAILPGNAHDDLRQWAADAIPPQRLHIANAWFAAGVLEGLQQYELI